MKLLLLLASASNAYVAAGIAFGWSIFDLDDPALHGDTAGWLSLSMMFMALALAWEPFVAVLRSYHR
jgi:hypothetical protein